jgi:hypothetical protein
MKGTIYFATTAQSQNKPEITGMRLKKALGLGG